MLKGKIIKGVGSFYTVYSYKEKKLHTLKARGIFRKQKIKPTVGDEVLFTVQDESGSIEEILERKNEMIRPSIANIDNIIIVAALREPDISFVLLDKMIINAMTGHADITVCFNKTDLADEEEIEFVRKQYENSGCNLMFASAVENTGLDELRKLVRGGCSIFMGVSGAGKSSIINRVFGRDLMDTSHVSRKIKRGRHTTRHSELFMMDEDTFVADTPGFSSLEVFGIEKEDLYHYYDEFIPYAECRFVNCVHVNEPDCGVKQAVSEGKISRTRYESYLQIFEEIKAKENIY